MRRSLLLAFLLTFSTFQASAQLSTSRKLYQLCKVWGYLKYHHPDNCSIRWNDLLLEKVDSVVASTNDAAFNAILYNLCLQTGVTTRPTTPMTIAGDTARNYNTAWFNSAQIAGNVRAFLDSVEADQIPNTSGCMLRINNFQDASYTSYIDFRSDSIRNITGFSYSNLRHRMLVYFYYWNAIQYFAPQIQIADSSWDSTLIRFMPDMITASGDSAFELTLAKVVSRLDDSHGFYNSRYYYKYIMGIDIATQYAYRAKLAIARIENRNVVVTSDEPNINSGDIITKINGLDADTFFTRWQPFFSESNLITKYRDMYTGLITGSGGSATHLELIDAGNNTKQVDMYTNLPAGQYANWYSSAVDTLPEWTTMKCGFGYVNMGKLARNDVQTMYQTLKHAPVIIFDIRNYPQGTLWDLKPLLFGVPTISARYFSPDLSYPGYYFTQNDFYNFGSWSNDSAYTGRVIILVNEQTQSQAEYTAQALSALPNALVIGSQTAGADGNISYLDLPSIRTYWTSLGWFQADWYNPQRAGIRVDSIVHPTISGIRQGIDEVLSKALDCKLGIGGIQASGMFTITQTGSTVVVSNPTSAGFDVQVFNTLGQKVIVRQGNYGNALINTEGMQSGIYILVAYDKNGLSRKGKIYVR